MAERILLYSFLVAISIPSNVWAIEARTTNERSVADKDSNLNKPSKTLGRQPEATDQSTELAATELVDSLLPELKSVLEHLRSADPRQYKLAIRDLAKSARRLELSKKRDQELYEIDVEMLQAQSSVRLLTAKLKVRDNQADRQRLRESVSRLQEAELKRTKYDVRLLQQRMDRTQKSLDAAEQRLRFKQDNFKTQLEKSYLGLLRKAGRQPDGESSGNESN